MQPKKLLNFQNRAKFRQYALSVNYMNLYHICANFGSRPIQVSEHGQLGFKKRQETVKLCFKPFRLQVKKN